MNNLLTFHKSVQGFNHISWGKPCEDASGSYANPEKHYYIAVVSDGHGADECYRSDKGSKIAVEITLADLQELAEKMTQTPEQEKRFYQDFLENPRYRQMTLRHLTDVIHAKWVDRVLENLRTEPPTEEELAPLQEANKQNYALSNRPEQVYGCTLIAALWMQRCLILIHQGDGRCDVFYADGTVNQPIPWDSRCMGTQTTSLCDDDVESSFRSCVIDLQDKPVMACYLGSDGVEDAYRDSEINMAGLHTFYKGLTCQVLRRTPEQLDDYLTEMLPRFSYSGLYNNAGSGDDISVAAIVDKDAARPFAAAFLRDTQIYTLQEDAFWKADAARSKIRKHGILQRRLLDAETAVNDSSNNLKMLQKQRTDLFDKIALAHASIAKVQQELDQLKSEQQLADSDAEQIRNGHLLQNLTFLNHLIAASDTFLLELQGRCHVKETDLHARESKLYELEKKLSDLDESIHDANLHQSALEENFRKQQNEFHEYDIAFQAAQEDSAKAKRALDMLLNTPLERTVYETPGHSQLDLASPASPHPALDEVQTTSEDANGSNLSSEEMESNSFFIDLETSDSK